jgi:redox-sensitive bicupin YhaK (pirin superfamily)
MAFRTLEGAGFEVRRAIPSRAFEAIGPFIFLDHFGPIDVRPGEAKGAPAHPHAGIETLTLLLEGRSVHKDSLGNESVMQPGEVQWMRAGRGVIHDEGPDADTLREGGRTHGVQLWLNMPKGHKQDDPAYRHFTTNDIPLVQGRESVARIIAGRSGDVTGPLRSTGAPFVAQASLKAGGALDLAAASRELALYVLTGGVVIGGTTVAPGWLARLSAGDRVALNAHGDSEVLLIGGDPLDAPVVRHGPFVMNTIAELEQAVRDYSAGRMGRIAA